MNTELTTYYVRFRHIPMELRFTPMYMIAVENIQIDAKKKATEYDLQCAICNELELLNYQPEDIRIENSQPINETV